MNRLIQKLINFLNARDTRVALLLSLFGVLPLLYLLKVWQVSLEPGSHDVWACGLCRRIDDVSFWTTVALLIACWAAHGGTRGTPATGPMVGINTLTLALLVVSTIVGALAYLYVVCKLDPGTFCTKERGMIRYIQYFEGGLMLFEIAVGHLFVMLLMIGNWNLSALSGTQRKWRIGASVAVFGAFFGILMTVAHLAHLMSEFCEGCPGWGSVGPNRFDCIKFVFAVWWPLIPLGIQTVINLRYLL